jgi:hypothetical protein
MDTAELLKLANEYRPDLVEKTAKAVTLLEQVAPEFVPEVTKDIEDIANAVNTKLAEAPKSKGGYKGGGYLAGLGGTILAGLAGAFATDLYDAAKRGLTKGGNYRRIMEANPELKDIESKRLKSSFDLIHRYAPEFTADPILGGAVLKNVAELPGNEATIIKDLINSRKNLIESKGRQFNAMGANNIGVLLGGNKGKSIEEIKEEEKAKQEVRADFDKGTPRHARLRR